MAERTKLVFDRFKQLKCICESRLESDCHFPRSSFDNSDKNSSKDTNNDMRGEKHFRMKGFQVTNS